MRLAASPRMIAALDQMAGDVDRARMSDAKKRARARLRALAESVAATPCENEADAMTFLRCLARATHGRIINTEGQHRADTLFASIAREGAAVPNHAKAAARAAGDALFGANDQ
jgi:hypothetical protein